MLTMMHSTAHSSVTVETRINKEGALQPICLVNVSQR